MHATTLLLAVVFAADTDPLVEKLKAVQPAALASLEYQLGYARKAISKLEGSIDHSAQLVHWLKEEERLSNRIDSIKAGTGFAAPPFDAKRKWGEIDWAQMIVVQRLEEHAVIRLQGTKTLMLFDGDIPENIVPIGIMIGKPGQGLSRPDQRVFLEVTGFGRIGLKGVPIVSVHRQNDRLKKLTK